MGLETPDDRTLVVRLEEVTGDLTYRFSLPATAPIPEGAAEGHDEDYSHYVVASGPYMVEGSEQINVSQPANEQEPAGGFVPPVLGEDGAVEEAGHLVLVRNPSWDPATDPLRAAYADRIELTLGGASDEEIARRVDAAEVDLAYNADSPFEQVARYRDDPALSDRVFMFPNNAIWSLTMNLAVPPFDDVHVRRAVSRAIDKARLVELLAEPAARGVRLQQLRRGRDTHGSRCLRVAAPSCRSSPIPTIPWLPGRRCGPPRTIETTTDDAIGSRVGTCERSSWMKVSISSKRGRSARTSSRSGST